EKSEIQWLADVLAKQTVQARIHVVLSGVHRNAILNCSYRGGRVENLARCGQRHFDVIVRRPTRRSYKDRRVVASAREIFKRSEFFACDDVESEFFARRVIQMNVRLHHSLVRRWKIDRVVTGLHSHTENELIGEAM